MPALPQSALAMESMYQLHVNEVARWAERLTCPGLDVEDIVHEVFAIAYERMHKFRGDSNVRTWLFGITNKVVLYRRRKQRWWRWLSGSADETAGHLVSERPDPLREAESNQVAAEVYRVLDRLSERDRQILILCELEELDASEVSQLLDISEVAVRVRLHRARARFTVAYEKLKQSKQRGMP